MRQFTVRAGVSARRARMAAMTLMATASVAGVAQAQIDSHSKSPIDITAERAEVSNSRCVAIWRGDAEAIQDKTHLRADTLTVYSRPNPRAEGKTKTAEPGASSCGGADRIEAEGHVYYMTDDQNARGDHAVYSQAKDEIVMTGDVIVVQGQNVARGSRLTIKVSTHEATMDANVGADGKPGRVRAVFYPDKSTTSQTPPKAGAGAGADPRP